MIFGFLLLYYTFIVLVTIFTQKWIENKDNKSWLDKAYISSLIFFRVSSITIMGVALFAKLIMFIYDYY